MMESLGVAENAKVISFMNHVSRCSTSVSPIKDLILSDTQIISSTVLEGSDGTCVSINICTSKVLI